jgi:hypothetical protein
MKPFPCRFCGTMLENLVVDLGMSPLCESFLAEDQVDTMEPFYPLHVWVCHECFLVQLNEYVTAAEIFTEYAYFSAFSTSWFSANGGMRADCGRVRSSAARADQDPPWPSDSGR